MKCISSAMVLGALLLLGACGGSGDALDSTQSDCKRSLAEALTPASSESQALADGDASEADAEGSLVQRFAVEVIGHEVTLRHYNAQYDCGTVVDFSFKRLGQTLRVIEEYSPGPPTTCAPCFYDLSATIHDVAEGSYTVELYGTKSDTLLFSEQVTVAK